MLRQRTQKVLRREVVMEKLVGIWWGLGVDRTEYSTKDIHYCIWHYLTKIYHPSLEKVTTNLYSAIKVVSYFQRWMAIRPWCGQNPRVSGPEPPSLVIKSPGPCELRMRTLPVKNTFGIVTLLKQEGCIGSWVPQTPSLTHSSQIKVVKTTMWGRTLGKQVSARQVSINKIYHVNMLYTEEWCRNDHPLRSFMRKNLG